MNKPVDLNLVNLVARAFRDGAAPETLPALYCWVDSNTTAPVNDAVLYSGSYRGLRRFFRQMMR